MSTILKIVHVVVAGQIGGAERFLTDLATRADRSGADHGIALMTPSDKLRDFFRDAGLSIHDRGPVHENPLAYLWRSWGPRDIAWLGEVIAKEQADILHCHTYGSHVLATRAGQRFHRPVIRTEHGVRHYRDPSCALFRHRALRNTTRIVAVSDFVARTIVSLAPEAEGKISVVHNGTDLSHFTPQTPVTETPFRVAVISRLEPIKRLHLAIEALTQAPQVQLTIAGDGAERSRLEQLTQEYGVTSRVQFLGHLNDPRPVIADCHAVLNCTQEEGLSLSLLEAAAMARPALAFASGGIPEVVVDGKTGWLTCDETASGLAVLLNKASADPAQMAVFGQAARKMAEAGFGIDTMCEAYGAVYRDVLSEHALAGR